MPPQANEQTSLLDSLSEAGLPPMAAQHFNFRAQDSTLQQDDKKSFATIRSSTTPLIVWSLLCVSLIVVATVVGSHIGLQIANTNQQNRLSPSTQSKYKKVQGIGFQIYTGGAPAVLNETESELLNTECVGLQSYGQVVGEVAPMLQCYIGNPDPMKDVQRRIEIMTDAVEKAYELTLANNNDNSETLQVFIAPEFFWRGVTGAYAFQQDELPDDPSVCGPICQILQGMENLVAQKRFEDWIFLFGTIVASDDLPTDDPYDFLFYNFAPVYKGYDPAKHSFEGKRFLVPKRYVSSSDFLTPQRHLNETVYKQLIGEPLPQHDQTVYNPHDFDQKRYDHSMWLKYKDELNSLGYTMIEYDWLLIDGLAMSIEICFDHQMRSALNTYLGDMITGRSTLIPSSTDSGLTYDRIPQHQAQISIVSSAGMTVTTDSLVLTNGGLIFLQDGLSNATNRMFWSVEGCEQGLQFEGGTEAATRRAFLSPTDVVLEHKALSNFDRFDLYDDFEVALDGAFSAKVYPPQITVFAPVDIPEVVRS